MSDFQPHTYVDIEALKLPAIDIETTGMIEKAAAYHKEINAIHPGQHELSMHAIAQGPFTDKIIQSNTTSRSTCRRAEKSIHLTPNPHDARSSNDAKTSAKT